MAKMKNDGITVMINIGIPPRVAELCKNVLEMFLNQTPELKLVSSTLPNGEIKLSFEPDLER